MIGAAGAFKRLFDLVFFIVSSFLPGATIQPVTRRLDLTVPEKPVPPAVMEINAVHPLNGEITSFYVDPALAVSGATLADIEFPPGASVVLVVRGNELVPAKGNTALLPGDHAYVFFRPEDRPFVELLFGAPET